MEFFIFESGSPVYSLQEVDLKGLRDVKFQPWASCQWVKISHGEFSLWLLIYRPSQTLKQLKTVKRLPYVEYTGESRLPCSEYTRESSLPGSEYIGEFRLR